MLELIAIVFLLLEKCPSLSVKSYIMKKEFQRLKQTKNILIIASVFLFFTNASWTYTEAIDQIPLINGSSAFSNILYFPRKKEYLVSYGFGSGSEEIEYEVSNSEKELQKDKSLNHSLQFKYSPNYNIFIGLEGEYRSVTSNVGNEQDSSIERIDTNGITEPIISFGRRISPPIERDFHPEMQLIFSASPKLKNGMLGTSDGKKGNNFRGGSSYSAEFQFGINDALSECVGNFYINYFDQATIIDMSNNSKTTVEPHSNYGLLATLKHNFYRDFFGTISGGIEKNSAHNVISDVNTLTDVRGNTARYSLGIIYPIKVNSIIGLTFNHSTSTYEFAGLAEDKLIYENSTIWLELKYRFQHKTL